MANKNDNESVFVRMQNKLYAFLDHTNISNYEFAFIILFLGIYFIYLQYQVKWIISEMYIKTYSELNLRTTRNLSRMNNFGRMRNF